MTKDTLSQQADPLALYELSVQYVWSDIEFIDQTYQTYRHHKPTLLREDFCGSAQLCYEWIKSRKINHAIGVDIDKHVLEWGNTQHLTQLNTHQAKRIQLLEQNVITPTNQKADVITALNFSYWSFTTRKQLNTYFNQAYHHLKDDGILFLDAYGGYESQQDLIETQQIDSPQGEVTYTWEQTAFNPISNTLSCHIHFDFIDGSRLNKAFSYHWRFWSLPELHDILLEAGFKQVDIYWQGFDEEGEADGHFIKTSVTDTEAGWICYLVAVK